MHRIFDAAAVNEVANHPAVRPFIGLADGGPLDFAAFVAEPANIVLAVPHGVIAFHHHEPGRYEQHTFILPEGRGAQALASLAEAYRWLFVQTDAAEVVTRIPKSNRAAALTARRVGFALTFTRSGAWEDGSDVEYFALTLDAWRERDETLAAEGEAFHEALEAAKAAAGSPLAAHPDDAAHNRAVGLACLMAKAGNPHKAAWSYNRWARLAGYQPISIIQPPPVFDVGDAVIRFKPELEVIQCR